MPGDGGERRARDGSGRQEYLKCFPAVIDALQDGVFKLRQVDLVWQREEMLTEGMRASADMTITKN